VARPTPSILHLLAQRPTLTGSGVTLDQLARQAAEAGWEQYAVVGVPAELEVTVPGVDAEHLFPLRFETLTLPFPVPGMSDVMPYASTRYSSIDDARWARLRESWYEHLDAVAQTVSPDVIHTHHLWLASSLVKRVFPLTPVVTHCHATGLRQMALCPERAPEIVAGLRRNDAFLVLDRAAVATVSERLDIDSDRIHVVGGGYRDDLFHRDGRGQTSGGELLYVGKLARAKGLHCLLDAFEALAADDPQLRLHVAGSGEGQEAIDLRARLAALGERAVVHGQLDQTRLAELMRHCDVLVLPSFYEGLPLVLCEAAACGCRVVASDLPAVRDPLGSALGNWLTTVELPPLIGPDEPVAAAVPAFVARLAEGIATALATLPETPPQVSDFTWAAVFGRVEAVWSSLREGAR